MEPGERPPAPPPNNAPPTRPHMWGATPCIEARACHKVRPTQRLSGQPKERLDEAVRSSASAFLRCPARHKALPAALSVTTTQKGLLNVDPILANPNCAQL
jgi:hypothetical protein